MSEFCNIKQSKDNGSKKDVSSKKQKFKKNKREFKKIVNFISASLVELKFNKIIIKHKFIDYQIKNSKIIWTFLGQPKKYFLSLTLNYKTIFFEIEIEHAQINISEIKII